MSREQASSEPRLHEELAMLLRDVETELQRMALWRLEPPSPTALLSVEPFACDQLAFHEWLQYIFLPRMKDILQHKGSLPAACAIAPMAEECFRELTADAGQLISRLQAIDNLINQQAVNPKQK